MKTQTNVVLLLLAIVFHGHALFTGSTVLNSSGAPLNNCTLVSSNGQWKFEIAEDKTLHIVHYQDPTTSRWIPNFSIANTSGSFNLYIQYSDGNIVYRRNYYDILWASNSACMLNSATNKASTLILSDDGVLFQYYSSPQLLVWRTSMISDTHVSVPTTDGGTIRVMGNFSTGIATATLNGVATNRAVGLSSSYASVFIPKGAGFNLTLMLRTCNAFHPVLISYPPPTAPSIGIQSPFIIVNGTNAGTNSLLCIHSLLPTILSCVNVSGGNYSPSIRVPLSVPTSLLYVSLRWIETGDTFNLTVFNYTSPQDAFANVNVSGNTAEEIFETIENAALGALTSSDTYERTSADGVSIYAAVANKNGNTTEGRLNGTATTSFSIPSSVIESLSRGNNGTGVTVVLSRIPFTVFPKDANWTILGDTIGLSLYVNMTHANVSGSQSLIEITMSLPADVNVTKDMVCVYWEEKMRGWSQDGCDTELGVDTVTCLCNHLTNFTIGRYNPPVIVNPTIENVGSPINREEGGFNKLYLIAIAGIVPIVLIIVIIAIIIKKRKKAIYCEPSLDIASNTNDDVQIEREIGRGRQSTVYLGKKSGTTAVAVKKSGDRERTKTLIIEANMLKDMHHPNVLLYLGMYREEGMTCLVTDYMDGNTLDHAMWKGMISDGEQAQNIMKEIAAGMSYLHENRVIHGRMCPQKVYVTSSMHVKISAYGSQSVDQLPQYMEKYLAPEVKKSRQLTIEGDIYSCGVIYEEILGCLEADTLGEPVQRWREVIQSCTTEVAAERKSMRIVGRRMNVPIPEKKRAKEIETDTYGIVSV